MDAPRLSRVNDIVCWIGGGVCGGSTKLNLTRTAPQPSSSTTLNVASCYNILNLLNVIKKTCNAHVLDVTFRTGGWRVLFHCDGDTFERERSNARMVRSQSLTSYHFSDRDTPQIIGFA